MNTAGQEWEKVVSNYQRNKCQVTTVYDATWRSMENNQKQMRTDKMIPHLIEGSLMGDSADTPTCQYIHR